MRQVIFFAKAIQRDRADHYQFLAKIQGHQLDTNFEDEDGSSLTVEQEDKAAEYLKRMNDRNRGFSGT